GVSDLSCGTRRVNRSPELREWDRMTKLLPDDGKGEGLAKPARASRAEPRGLGLLADLVSELAISSSSGVSFIATCLDRVIETWDLRAARAVVNDAVLGVQLFNSGRRPFVLNANPSHLTAMRSGIHSESPVVGGSDALCAF